MSSSASNSNPSFSADLASLYECPVCFEYISPPILQCRNGHMVCSHCRLKLNCSPSCQSLLGTSRNLALEKALSNVHFPCKFSTEGCQATMLLTDKGAHEEHCAWRSTCSCPFCNWQGVMDQVLPHFISQHPEINKTHGDRFIFQLGADFFSHSGFGRWAGLQTCHGHHFLFISNKEKMVSGDGHHHDRFLAAVQLIGTRSRAIDFSYRLMLGGDRHRLSWEATPLSIHDSLNSAARNHECLVFESTDGGQLFAQNGFLNIDVKVEKYSKNNFDS